MPRTPKRVNGLTSEEVTTPNHLSERGTHMRHIHFALRADGVVLVVMQEEGNPLVPFHCIYRRDVAQMAEWFREAQRRIEAIDPARSGDGTSSSDGSRPWSCGVIDERPRRTSPRRGSGQRS